MRRTAVAGAALVLALTACSSGTDPQPAPSSPGSEHGSYANCLSAHGVSSPPAGPAAPPGVDPATWAAAQQACADMAPGPAN